jgi:exosome complex component CSL4
MKEKKKIVIPGEEIGTSEEFLAGEGTYESGGVIRSYYLGELDLDSKEMVAKVTPVNPPVKLNNDDIVLAHVMDVRNSIVMVSVIRVEGKDRHVSGETQGAIHVSKISEGYTSDVWKEYRIGDIIRAVVVSTKPSLQLATNRPKLGVLLGLCTKCRMPLVKKDNILFCESCKRSEMRNMAPDYGNYRIEKP